MEFRQIMPMRDIVDTGNYDEFIKEIELKRSTISLKKEQITTETLTIELKDITPELNTGKYQTTFDDVQMNFFFNNKKSDRLYVFLNGASKKGQFNRWSWNSNGYTLAIGDPMVEIHDLKLGWYYGTKDKDYRKVTSEFIQHFCKVLGIRYSNVCVYGSSGGGTASIYISSLIPGSKSVSINPQIDIRLQKQYKRLQRDMHLKVDDETLSYRNDVYTTLKGSKSTHWIIVNALSRWDYDSAKELASKYNHPLEYGAFKIENVIFWIYDAKPVLNAHKEFNAHRSMDYLQLFVFLDEIIFTVDGSQPELIKDISLALNEIWSERYDNKHEIVKLKQMKNIEI